MSDKKTVLVGVGTSDEREIGIEFGVAIRAKDGRVSKCIQLENKEGFILQVENPKESGRAVPSIRKGIFDKSKAIGCLLDFILIALVSFLVCSVIWKVFFNDLFLF